jgi:metal-responsive CopG/Arc/MetJ family transcriptional regulator
MEETKLIGVYLPKEMIKALKKRAADEETNVSELIRRLLNTELKNTKEKENG